MFNFRHTTLPNGLRIAAEVAPQGYSTSLGYFVRTGACDEVDPESGLSHFLEHMMFKGTARRSAKDVNRELDELGGQSNAYTTEEQTVYYATVLPKYQHRMIDLLTDMMRPRLAEDDFQTERQVILEEIAKYEDQPPFGAFERAMELHFSPRGLGRRVLGTEQSIEAMTAARMRDYFARRYAPQNMVLAAAGNVDFDSLVEQAERLTRDWQPAELPAPAADDLNTVPEGIVLESELRIPDASQVYLVRICDGPAINDNDRYAARLLAMILGDESGSRFFWELIDTGRAEACVMWSQEFASRGAMFTYLACRPEDLKKNRKSIDRLSEKLVKEGIDEAELDRAKSKTIAGCIMQSDRPSNRLFGVGNGWQMRNEYVELDAMLERYRAVTVEDINRLARTILTSRCTEVVAAARLVLRPTANGVDVSGGSITQPWI